MVKNSLLETHPEIAKEWHPTKNGKLKPEDVVAGSTRKVWWYRPYDDPETGKHFDFEWKARIFNRTINRTDCPYLTGKAVWKGYNDLETLYPEIAKEWHPTKNGELKPEDVTAGSQRKVWWYCPYDDTETGKHFDFEWEARIVNRTTHGNDCPYLTGQAVWKGYNDLETLYPEIAKEWHPTKNGKLKPEDVVAGSTRKVWWYRPYDDPETGKHFDFEWKARIFNRTINRTDCPYLTGQAVWKGYNDLQSCFPDIALEWSEKNKFLDPDTIYKYSNRKVWWHCKICGTDWRTSVANRTVVGTNCPVCARKKQKHFLN